MAELIQREDSLNTGREKLNNAIKAFNETVVEGDSSVEAAQARVDSEGNVYSTLKERLDDKDTEFSSQLADKANRDEVRENTFTRPINVNEMDTETKQLFTGGAVAVVGENAVGKENIKPKSVDRTRTNFLSTDNLYIYENAVLDTTLTDTGNEYPSAQFDTSDFIPITSGLTYWMSKGMRHVMFYSSEKSYVSTITSTASRYEPYSFVAPASGYIRVAIYKESSMDFTVTQNELIDIGRDIKFNVPIVDSIDNGSIINGAVDHTRTNFLRTGKNLFNKATRIQGVLLADTGGTTPAAGYVTSEYIRLKKNTDYTFSPVRAYSIYKTSGKLLEYVNTGNNESEVTIKPKQDCLIRVSIHERNVDSFQIEKGTVRTSYESFRYKIPGLETEKIDTTLGDIQVIKSGETFTLISPFNDLQDIKIETKRNGSHNGSFNFVGTTIGETFIHDTSDDITPIRTFYTVGANHGYFCAEVTASGKTTADIGSVWTDGTNEWTLVEVSGDILTLIPDYKEVDGTAVTLSLPTIDLTHVSGATNTETISIANVSSKQLYPSINKISVKYVLDGKAITEDGTYYGDELQVQEQYHIMDYKSIVDWAQANIGESYANNEIEGIVQMFNNFTFTKGLNCTTSHGLLPLKEVRLGRCGFLQSNPLNADGYTSKRFMPNVKVKDGFDFEKGVDLDTYNTSLIFKHEDSIDSSVPPSHTVDWLYDSSGNKSFGFSLGYIVDKTNSKNGDRVANTLDTWDMRSTTKNYPIAITGLTLSPGEYLQFEGFRNYLSPESVGVATGLCVVKDKKDTYLYALFNKQLTGVNKELLDDIGKNITLLQSNNLNVLNDTVDSSGVVMSSTGTVGNGVLKIN